MSDTGTLYLIPTPISDQDPLEVLSPDVIGTIRRLRHFVVEAERTAGRFLSRVLSQEALSSISFEVLDEHSVKKDVPRLLERALAGEDMGLISEAGCPCVADPGSDLVAEAHRQGVHVVPLAGPSSILLALMASGFSGQRFQFLGYIPAESAARKTALKSIERECLRDGMTRIFIEAPYRNRALLEDALKVLDGRTRLCVAASLGCAAEKVRSTSVERWKESPFEIGKEPAIFLMAPGASPGNEARPEPRSHGPGGVSGHGPRRRPDVKGKGHRLPRGPRGA